MSAQSLDAMTKWLDKMAADPAPLSHAKVVRDKPTEAADAYFSPDGVKHFLATVPRAEFVELSDAGHTAAGDDNDAFSDVVVEFVKRLTG